MRDKEKLPQWHPLSDSRGCPPGRVYRENGTVAAFFIDAGKKAALKWRGI